MDEDDKYLIWHAEQMTNIQKRFAQMMIADLGKFSFSGKYNKKYRNFLIDKYKNYIEQG